MMFAPIRVAVAASLALAAFGAQAVTFDFESETAGVKGPSFSMVSGGLGVTITRIGGGDVSVTSSVFPAGWGQNALSPFANTSAGAFLLTFSSAISAISVDVGDFQPSDADVFSLTAGSGSTSGSQGGTTGFPVFSTLSLSGVNSFTAVLSGGSASFPESVFWDNIQVTAVPEPGTMAMLALGLAGLGVVARRRNTKA